MQPLAQPPKDFGPRMIEWLFRMWRRVNVAGGLAWSVISKTGSNLTDIETRNHSDLQSLQGGTTNEYYHNTAHEDALVDIIDTQWSTGIVGSGNLVSDGGSGTIDVAASSVLLRATDSDTDDLVQYAVSASTGLAITDLQNNYIYIEYNAGAPQYVATTSQRTDTNTNVLVARVYRNGTDVHFNNYAVVRANDNMRRVALRFVETEPTAHASGVMLSETGTRNIAITSGVLWQCTNRILINSFDSSAAGTFTYIYDDGAGGWTEQTAQTQVNNTQYDDGSGTLQTLTANRYAVGWVYIEVDGDVLVLYGQGDYLLSQANAAEAPASVPPRISAQGLLIGKIVLQKSASSFLSVESAFTSQLTVSTVNDHEQLAGLLGGGANDHYHITGTQHTDLTDGGDSTLHYHDSDRDLTNATGIADVTNLDPVAWKGWIGGSITPASAVVTSNGTTVTLTVEASGTGDIDLIFDSGNVIFDCTPAQTIELTAGTDTSPTENYIYVLATDTTQLTKSTVGWPDAEHHPIGRFLVQTAASVQTYGTYKTHLWTDHIWNSTSENGHISHLNTWIRHQPATWEDGMALTPTINAGSPDSIDIAVTAGNVFQLHKHAFPALDTATGSVIFIANSSSGAYTVATKLPQELADGTAIGNGNRISYVIWGAVSEDTADGKVFVNLPTAFYANDAAAIADDFGYSTYDIPASFNATAVLIARLIFSYSSSGGGTLTLVSNIDLRGLLPSTSVGGSLGTAATLQGAYNISPVPQIVTDAVSGAVQIQRGSAADTDAVFEVLNGAGSAVMSVTGERATLVTPALGTPASGVLTNCTGLPIAGGGTGQTTAQAAIDALSAVSAATNEYVLTKDTATGNAIWKASVSLATVRAVATLRI